MVPAEGSEPLQFTSVYAVSSSLQAKTCMERAVMQVNNFPVQSGTDSLSSYFPPPPPKHQKGGALNHRPG